MRLTAEEEEVLGGKQGEAVRRALQMQVTVGDFFQADRFVPVTSVHMMAEIESMGKPGLDWIESMEFAKFLDNAADVEAFAKLPQAFGFSIDYTDTGMNLRSYYPDFVAVGSDEVHWLLETKGQETGDVARKEMAANLWCENATKLSKSTWKYVKVPQKDFFALQPTRLADLAVLQPHLFH